MTLWNRITAALSALALGEGLGAVFDRLRTPPELGVGFAIAVIALGAKMAKADGTVSRSEVAAFREVFVLPRGEERNAARVFNLARQDTMGFEEYARKIAAMFRDDRQVLVDLMEGLFYIAVADGTYHDKEDAFLYRVGEIFEMEDRRFRSLRSRFVPDALPDPHAVLGIAADAPLHEARAAWRRAVLDTHPDRMIARGVPPEALRMAEKRLRAVNDAYAAISGVRQGAPME